jgi:hypothetical protein
MRAAKQGRLLKRWLSGLLLLSCMSGLSVQAQEPGYLPPLASEAERATGRVGLGLLNTTVLQARFDPMAHQVILRLERRFDDDDFMAANRLKCSLPPNRTAEQSLPVFLAEYDALANLVRQQNRTISRLQSELSDRLEEIRRLQQGKPGSSSGSSRWLSDATVSLPSPLNMHLTLFQKLGCAVAYSGRAALTLTQVTNGQSLSADASEIQFDPSPKLILTIPIPRERFFAVFQGSRKVSGVLQEVIDYTAYDHSFSISGKDLQPFLRLAEQLGP